MNMASYTSERIRWRLFLIFVAICLVLLVLHTTGHLSTAVGYLQIPFSAAQSWISDRIGGVESTLSIPGDVAGLQAENERLRMQIAKLERQNEELTEIYAEHSWLSSLLDYARQTPEYHRVAVDVIGWDTSNFVRRLKISKGDLDGIEPGMPVETERGLVGRVIAVSPHSAQVQLLTDADSSISARLGASRADGTVQGQLTTDLTIKWIKQDVPVSENELVMTSGLGGYLPPDLVIGRIVRVEQSASQLFQEARVRPAVDFDRLEIVLVITGFEPADLTTEDDSP
ncbi:MAG: rod shape-determining protein MreC [Ardenticatenales bacterium]|nr:rod shape-determining protein MreC [Ardenticatenales bacterium]